MATLNEQISAYRRYTAFRLTFIVVCIAVAIIVAFYSLSIANFPLTLDDVIHVFSDHLNGISYDITTPEGIMDDIVFNTLLPRVIFAMIAGIGLAISGVTMQSVMKNPLAEPYTTGVSSGAYLGVALIMAMNFSILSTGGVVSNAILFALIPVFIILIMSPKMNNSVATLILIGTAISYMFNAASTLILVASESETVAEVYRWQVGSFSGLQWHSTIIASIVVILGSMIIFVLSKKLNIIMMGDETAKSLGVNVKRMRLACLFIMAVIVAVVVAFCGILGFVGLICPHMIRLVLGADNRFVIPAACSFGAAFLVVADTIVRYISLLDMIPVGAVVSLIGAPVFMIILIVNRRGVW